MSSGNTALGFLGRSPIPVAAIVRALAHGGQIENVILLTTKEGGLTDDQSTALRNWIQDNTSISSMEVCHCFSNANEDLNIIAAEIESRLDAGISDVFFGPGTMEMNALMAISCQKRSPSSPRPWYKLDPSQRAVKNEGSRLVNLYDSSQMVDAKLSLDDVISILGLRPLVPDGPFPLVPSAGASKKVTPVVDEIDLGREDRLLLTWSVQNGEIEPRQFEDRLLKNVALIEPLLSEHSYTLKVRCLKEWGMHGHQKGTSLRERLGQYRMVVSWDL